MKKVLLSFICAIFCCSGYSQQDANSLLIDLGKKDQAVRHALAKALQQGQADSIVHYAQMQQLVDEENQHLASSVLKTESLDGLSSEAYNALFLIVDHADIKYQKRHFGTLRRLSQQGHIKPQSIATLKDRMLMHLGRKQIYGTQTKAKPITITDNRSDIELTNYVWSVRRPKNLDKRRSKVGLGTMREQGKAHQQTGYKMIFDPQISKKEIISLTTPRKE